MFNKIKMEGENIPTVTNEFICHSIIRLFGLYALTQKKIETYLHIYIHIFSTYLNFLLLRPTF